MDIEYNKIYGVYTYNKKSRLDVGTWAMKKLVPSDHDSWATRLVIKRLDGENNGTVSSAHKVGIFTESGTVRLDLGTQAMKKEIPATHDSWATRLVIKALKDGKIDASKSGHVKYGDVVGIFCEDDSVRLDLGLDAMQKEVPASHESYATELSIDSIDPVVDFVDIEGIEYDVKQAKILSQGPVSLFHQTVFNNTGIEQTSNIHGEESISETTGWSDSLAIKVGVKTTFKTKIPFVAEGGIEMSVEASNTYQWNGSTTTSRKWGFNTPIKVPPHTNAAVIVGVSVSTIAVPYTMTGTYVYKSGKRARGTVIGLYTGTNSSDLSVSYSYLDSAADSVITKTVQIK